ncbi:hypothetical protein AB0E08_48380 [Streptomyces sp. NPDC048281]|uniref:hypothetical protein n=1 Tax=Streptomyces sp. NPDC048281 TaxID=3154715 RepID=UPI003441B52A
MGTQTGAMNEPGQVSDRTKELLALFADAPEMGRTALDNVLRESATAPGGEPALSMVSAGRAGSRIGDVSELTVIFPLAPGGAARMRAFLKLLNGNFSGADRVGTLHNMRFVFLDNDTKLLFATAYDGEWDTYIDDFATKIPDLMDILGSSLDGYPGIRSPEVKDYIARYQITAEGWYVANPYLSVPEAKRLQRVGSAVDAFLDEIG